MKFPKVIVRIKDKVEFILIDNSNGLYFTKNGGIFRNNITPYEVFMKWNINKGLFKAI